MATAADLAGLTRNPIHMSQNWLASQLPPLDLRMHSGEKVAPDPGLILLGLSPSFLLPGHHAGLASVFTQMFQIFRSSLSSLPA